MCFLQTKCKTLHQQEDYNSLYCNTCFITVVWVGNHNYPQGMPVLSINNRLKILLLSLWVFFLEMDKKLD